MDNLSFELNQGEGFVGHLFAIQPGDQPPRPAFVPNRCPDGVAEKKAKVVGLHIKLAVERRSNLAIVALERRMFDTEGNLAVTGIADTKDIAKLNIQRRFDLRGDFYKVWKNRLS